MPPNAITEAVAEIRDIPGVEVLKELYQTEESSEWTLKIRLSPSDLDKQSSIPAKTDWYVRIEETYPGGKIRIYPAGENGITKTYPHQSLNIAGNDDDPWRKGNICVDRYIGSVGRTGGFEEPFDETERLRWYILRALKWLECASKGELRQEDEPYELPAFPNSGSQPQFAYNETQSSFQSWAKCSDQYGFACLSKENNTTVRAAIDYLDLEGESIYTPEWGDVVQTDEIIPGIWWLLDEAPIKPPWEVPEDWSGLETLLSGAEENVFEVLGRVRESYPDAVFSYLLLGFPIPEFIGEENEYIHWQAIRIDDIPDPSGFNGFRDTAGNRIRLTRMSFKSESVTWIESDNWAQEQLLRRGKIKKILRENNILIIGAGALGSAVAENLLRDGCTNLTIVDGEKFEIGNVARHTLSLNALYEYKAAALADRLRELSPHATIHCVNSQYPLSGDEWDTVPTPNVILDCTGSNQVLYALNKESQEWNSAKLVVSTALGPRGKRLYTYSTFTQSFDARDFEEQIEPWTLQDLSEYHPEEALIPERVGCWHPASVITMNTIATWAGIVPRQIEDSTRLGKGESSFNVMEASRNQGSFSVTPRNEPFPDAIRWKSQAGEILELPRICLDEMIEYFNRDTPDETGGILIGQYTDESHARIIRASDPPPDSVQSPKTFLRGTEEVNDALKESRERHGLYYIGEWHTHPGSKPNISAQDKREMQSIANNESYDCPNPFLIVIGGNGQAGYRLNSYFFHREGECEQLTPAREDNPDAIDVDSSTGFIRYTLDGSTHD